MRKKKIGYSRSHAASLVLLGAAAGVAGCEHPITNGPFPDSHGGGANAGGAGTATTSTGDAGNPANSNTETDPVLNPGDDAGESGSTGGTGATHGDAGPALAAGDDALWCNARQVFEDACQTCHGSEPTGAPMSLVTHADTQALSVLDSSTPMAEAIAARIHDPARPMPPISSEPLTHAQLAALDAWLAAGTPDGDCATRDEENPLGVASEEEFTWPADCEEFYEIRAHQNGLPYRVPANYEANVSIDIPVPWAGKGSGPVQALAIRPITSNKRVVHHWILYHGVLDFITSWSPGKQPETFAHDIGVYMPSSGNFRLNMHYYNKGNPSAELDESGLEVCITRNPRPKTATTNMFGTILLSVPNTGRSVTTSTCTVLNTEPVHIITSSPHMHSYGVHAKFEILRADGSVEVLDDTPFDWEDQKVTKVDAVVNFGDRIKTTCIYENRGPRTVTFGMLSADEMCFNFARYYPMDGLICL